jgi:glycerol-3-phosphate acyltransferase PlsY
MHAAHQQNFLIDSLLVIIIVAYLGIAFQFWTRRRGTAGRATTALGQLVVIFVFCALCGYLPRLVALPEALLISAHVVLAAAAWAYFFSGNVDRLTVALDFADTETRTGAREVAIDRETEACAKLAEQAGAPVTAQLIRDRMRHRRAADAASASPADPSAAAGTG